MDHSYPSDISREQFDIIQPILESARKKTRPRRIDLYDVFCGILYILKSACQWRMLPKEFPKWRSCHYYFSVWSEKETDETESVLEKVLKKIGWDGSSEKWPRRKNQLYNR
jgi:transposase